MVVPAQTLNPVWKEKFTFPIHADEALHCDVWDKDKFLRDDPLGNVVLQLGSTLARTFVWSACLLPFAVF